MTNKIKHIPDGYHTVTPYLIIKDAANAIKFYKKAFGATEIMTMAGPNGVVKHAEIKIGNAPIMLSDECHEMNIHSPQTLGGSPVIIHLYVEDVDSLTKQAVAAGAKVLRPVQDQFYGDRSGSIADPYGHIWNISTHIEDVPLAELQKRSEAFMKQQCKS